MLGTWKGSGGGEYPTIDAFEYNEELTIGHVGKPFLSYQQKTKDATTGMPLHAETGYIRPVGRGAIEFVIVQPSGIIEIDEGSVEGNNGGGSIVVESTLVATTATAKEVSGVRRRLEFEADELRYELDMAAVGQPMQFHLRATLARANGES